VTQYKEVRRYSASWFLLINMELRRGWGKGDIVGNCWQAAYWMGGNDKDSFCN